MTRYIIASYIFSASSFESGRNFASAITNQYAMFTIDVPHDLIYFFSFLFFLNPPPF